MPVLSRFAGFLILLTVFLSQIPLKADEPVSPVTILIGTFLGDGQRNYYGNEAPAALNTQWRHYLGKGKTIISTRIGEKEWAGAGWTGQPLLVREADSLYIIQGAFDHHLKKLNAHTGRLIWQYRFDDVIKGTGTIWINPEPSAPADQILIMQGSRRGYDKDLYSRFVPSFRAVSYITGEELWRMDVPLTASYSRDVDGSALVIGDTAYIGLENAEWTIFNPDPAAAAWKDGMKQPRIFAKHLLYEPADRHKHGGNLVVESSPAILGDRIYITAGSGHVFGYHLKKRTIDWDFYIGSDIDGSPVVTGDGCLLVTVEKQYIDGPGGVFKLDPQRPPDQSVVWFFPTMDDSLLSWAGGVIGSAGVVDRTRIEGFPSLCAFMAIDGYLYVVDHTRLDTNAGTVAGPDGIKHFPKPLEVYREKIGPSISTPVLIGNRLIAAGYHGIYLFEFDMNGKFQLLASRAHAAFEATPVVHDRIIYIAGRDGYLYSFGE